MEKLTSPRMKMYFTYFSILILIILAVWHFFYRNQPPQVITSRNYFNKEEISEKKTTKTSKQPDSTEGVIGINKDKKASDITELPSIKEKNADKNYIVSCEKKTPDENSKLEELKEYFHESKEKSISQLNQLRSIKSDFMKLIISDDLNNIEKITQLKQYLKDNPENSLAHWHLLLSCIAIEDISQDCNPDIVTNAIASDPGNGAVWFNVANLRIKKNDIEGTLSALQQIVETSTFDVHYGRHLELFESVISNSGRGSSKETKINAIGYATAVPFPRFIDVFNFCKEQSVSRPDISQLCLMVGQNLAQNSKTYISKFIGFGLQKSIYELTGDDESLAEVQKKRDQSDYYKFSKLREKAVILLDYDEILLNDYFQQFKLYGENVAFQHLIEESIRLSKNPDYNPCPKGL